MSVLWAHRLTVLFMVVALMLLLASSIAGVVR